MRTLHDAAGEGAGAPAVPNRVLTSERRGRRGRWSARRGYSNSQPGRRPGGASGSMYHSVENQSANLAGGMSTK